MLIVTDMKRLPEFGFEDTGRTDSKGRAIWEKVVLTPNNAAFAYIVNPMVPAQQVDNVMILAVMTEDADTGFDAGFPTETMVEMINAGLVADVSLKESNYSILHHIVEPKDKAMIANALAIEDAETSRERLLHTIQTLSCGNISTGDLCFDLIGILKKLEHMTKSYEEQSKAFANSRRNAEKQYKCLRQAVADFFITEGHTAIETSRGVLTLPEPTKYVEIGDETVIPDEYKRVKKIERPDKLLIRRAIEEGKTVPGAALAESRMIQISNSATAA